MKLDLGVLSRETLDIYNGEEFIASAKKPGKGLLIEIYKADMELVTDDLEKLIEILEKIVAKILSNNIENKVFTIETLEEKGIDYTLQMAIFKAYMQFVSKAASNPN